MYIRKCITKETHSCTSVPCGRLHNETKTILMVISPTTHQSAATCLPSTSSGPMSVLMICPIPLCVFHNQGAFLALYVPPSVSPHRVLPCRLGGGYVDGCSGCLYVVDPPGSDSPLVVFDGVEPSVIPLSQFGYCPVVMEIQFIALDYSAEGHQVCVCDGVPASRALPSFRVGCLVWPCTCCS